MYYCKESRVLVGKDLCSKCVNDIRTLLVLTLIGAV